MLLVGLTGGIGAGKSTVARLLERRGAVVVDADVLARDAVAPGTAGHHAVVERFGEGILAADGRIDRQALGRTVFADEGARRHLESIVHPEVFRLLAERVAPYRDTDAVVVFDAPLIVETGFASQCDVVVLVRASPETRVRRLVRDRGMREEDAGARIAAQAPDEEKRRRADVIVENEAGSEDLERRVDDLWRLLRERAGVPAGGRPP